MRPPARGPVARLRVIDLGVGIAGPEIAQFLGDFGAEVIKVESVTHLDFLRAHSGGTPETVNRTPAFNTVNRNKQSLALDLRNASAQALLLQLARTADVLVENRPAGVLERWGLAPEVFRAARPDLIVVRSQGYGASGPYRDFLAVGPNVHAFSGLTHLWNHPEPDRPLGGQLNHPDHLASKLGALLVLAALERRDRSGEGAIVEISQAEVAASLMGEVFLDALINGRDAGPTGSRRLGAAPSGAYPCRSEPALGAGDDRWVALSVRNDSQWRGLCNTMERPDLARDSRFATHLARRRRAPELDIVVSNWCVNLTAVEAAQRLSASGVPASVLFSAEELFMDVDLRERGAIVAIDHSEVGTRCYLGQPVRSPQLSASYAPAPRLGEHAQQICGDLLGKTPAELERLQDEGSVQRAVLGPGTNP